MEKRTALTLLALVAMLSLPAVEASSNVTINLFYGYSCPHCEKAIEYLSGRVEENPRIKLETFEVYRNDTNRELAQKMCSEQGIEFRGVPTTFIGGEPFVGFSESIKSRMEEKIGEELGGQETGEKEEVKETLSVPVLGEVDLKAMSLPVLSAFLGFLDSFNPCCFFVLFFLLSMLVYAESRKRMLLIGGTFVFFSGLIYFLFMTAWLNFFLVTKEMEIITTVAGLVALVIGAINVKDFLFFKKGVSLTISEKQRSSLMGRMRELLKASSLSTMMAGTVVLAVTANLYELLCTAGLPMVFTKILVLNDLPKTSYYFYLALYNLVYILPLLTVVIIFTATLGKKKLSEKQGRYLKLLSGMMMLSLGSLLLFKPQLLDNPAAAIGLLLGSIAVTGLIILAKRWRKSK